MKKNIFLSTLLFMLVCINGKAQIVIQTGQPIADYVNNHLLGLGVTASNITFSGNNAQIGAFNGTSAGMGFLDGTVISSGPVAALNPSALVIDPGYSTTNNADLIAVAQSVTTNPAASGINNSEDVAILEFDFVPQSDLVSLRFIFGSDEYETWINSQYNDAFGFFVSGPGISGPYSSPSGFPNGSANLALVPGTTLPITISTIYPANASSLATSNPAGLNSQLYVDNSMGTNVSVQGYTVPMDISFPVICGETYHFKFAVGDMGDNSLATYVFLEAGSFTSPPISLSLENASGTGGNNIIEACTDASFLFTRSLCQSLTDIAINFTLTGSATNGVDYEITQTSPLMMLAGEDSLIMELTTFADGLAEGSETITITIDYIDQYGNPQTSTGTFFLSDIQPLSINTNDPTVQCFTDSAHLVATASGGSGNYEYEWANSTVTTPDRYVEALQNGIFYFPVTLFDECLGSYTDSVKMTVNQTLAIDTMMTFPASACTPDGAVSGVGVGITGVPIYHWEGPHTGGPSQINASVMQNLSPGWYVFSITDNVCQVTDSVFLDSEPGPIANFTPLNYVGCDPIDLIISNTSENATSFDWDFGNGNTLFENGLNNHQQGYTFNTVIRLIAINGPCRDTLETTIGVVKCGCTDPQALNYDPTAIQDDGSCLVPDPLIIVPNIFTPNGDGENDFFMITATYSTEITMQITNRWGNVVFEGTGVNPQWDGKLNGEVLPDGVYFLTYKVRGLKDQEVSGHSFLQLIR